MTIGRNGDSITHTMKGNARNSFFRERPPRLQADLKAKPDATVPEPAGGNARPGVPVIACNE